MVQTLKGWKRLVFRTGTWLSHRPLWYALCGGIGVVLFWRGVWLTADFVAFRIGVGSGSHGSIDVSGLLWWDGPLSLAMGALILLVINAFVSSLIGNEVIISSLRAERRANEAEGRMEATELSEIEAVRRSLTAATAKLDDLERHVNKIPAGK